MAHTLIAAVPCPGVSQQLGKAAGGCRHKATSWLADGWPLSAQGGIKRTKAQSDFFTVGRLPSLALWINGVDAPPKGLSISYFGLRFFFLILFIELLR
jgi:hypothetical protein